jgi:hypothetical protein
MLGKNTLRYAGYATVLIVILTLTGIFNSFAQRYVLADSLSLSTVLLIGALVGTGYVTASQERERRTNVVMVNGMIGSTLVAAALVLVVIFTETVNTRFVFPNLARLLGTPLTFGQDNLLTSIGLLLGAGMVMGLLGGMLVYLTTRAREILFITTSLTIVIGILQGQINTIITLPDALAMFIVFGAAYGAARVLHNLALPIRLGLGAIIGLIGGGIVGVLANGSGLAGSGWIGGRVPIILSLAPRDNFVVLLLIFAGIGVVGAVIVRSTRGIHNGAWSLMVGLLVLGILNSQGEMTLLTTAAIPSATGRHTSRKRVRAASAGRSAVNAGAGIRRAAHRADLYPAVCRIIHHQYDQPHGAVHYNGAWLKRDDRLCRNA